jgi:hypothetical protein
MALTNKTDINRQPRRSAQIDNYYVDLRADQERQEWQKIEQPKQPRRLEEKTYRRATLVLALFLLAGAAYWQFGRRPAAAPNEIKKEIGGSKWYMVRLADKEVFYGQVVDQSADPVILNSVYYDYDQPKDGEAPKAEETPNMRLVKRGKEAHGPSGTMNIVRSQVMFMEPLADDSKVLKAILEYEKQNQ